MLHTERHRGRSRSRVLYWFRTPPGVRVGRAALDEEAIRLIEEVNPDVEFDWTRILKSHGEPPDPPAAPHRRDRPWREHVSGSRAPVRPAPLVLENAGQRGAPAVEPAPAFDDGDGDVLQTAEPPVEPPTAAHARLGAEAVLRLRARHAEILARITEKVADPARREELKSQAERLNPDAWVTEDEVQAGLEQYESVFASLRTVVGRKRRRPRRQGQRESIPQNAPAQSETAASDAAEPHDEEPDDRFGA